MPSKKVLCNISGHELPIVLTDDMQLVQTYTKILEVFDEVHFLCRSIHTSNQTIKHPDKPIYVHHVKVSNNILGKTIGAVWQLYRTAKEKDRQYKIDCFVASDTTIGGTVGFLLNVFHKKRYLLEIQAEMTRISPKVVGFWKSVLFRWITLWNAKFAFRVRAVSETVKSQLLADGLNPDTLRVVTSRVKIDRFDYTAYPNAALEVRQRYSIQAHEQLFVFVGRLVVFKGLTFLLKALADFDLVPCKLLIVGDGILREKLTNEVQDLGLVDRVIFHGTVDFSEVPYYMAAADLMLMPSTDEGFPRVMLEAMAMKKLVVGSLVGGVNDIAQDGINGYFFPPQDPEAIKRALNRVYQQGNQAFCIDNAYQLVIQKYEFEVAMIPYTNLMKEMLS